MVSVIIPVYNGEKTVSRCLESLIRQKNSNFEIIIVNDGSIDDSEKICRQFGENDDRISIITIPNGGVSNARNKGLEKAKGDWIAFVDVDDYVDEDYLTIPSESESADVIEKNYTIVGKNNTESITISERLVFQFGYNLNSYFIEYINYKTRALWNKIFKRKIIEGRLFKSEVVMGEDFIFFLECYPAIKSYELCPRGRYFYCEAENSATSKNLKNIAKRLDGLIYNARIITNIMESNPCMPIYTAVLYRIYLPLIAKHEDKLWARQEKALLKIKRSLIQADFSLTGNMNRMKLIFDWLEDWIMFKIRRHEGV